MNPCSAWASAIPPELTHLQLHNAHSHRQHRHRFHTKLPPRGGSGPPEGRKPLTFPWHQSPSTPHPCARRNPRHPLQGAVPMGDGWDEGTRVRASLRNNKRREGEGREGQKIENKVPAGGLKAPSSSCFQGHHLPRGECLAKPLSPRAGHAPLLPLGRSPPLQDGNPQHSQLAPSLTTLPLSHEQRRS